jgi:putative SOS response-associated peptidase YedK
MCNLYANTIPVSAMRAFFDIAPARDHLGNAAALPAIFPKTLAPFVAVDQDGARFLSLGSWGFLLPQKSKRTGLPISPKAVNNARDDRLRTAPFWADSFARRRCLIPASSYCETKGRQPATHHWFGLKGQGARPPFAFAGIWRAGPGGDGPRYLTSMVTTNPNSLTAQVHPDRMPVILHPDDYATWLTGGGDDAFALLRPFPADQMVLHQQGIGLTADHGGLGEGAVIS